MSRNVSALSHSSFNSCLPDAQESKMDGTPGGDGTNPPLHTVESFIASLTNDVEGELLIVPDSRK